MCLANMTLYLLESLAIREQPSPNLTKHDDVSLHSHIVAYRTSSHRETDTQY